MKDTHSSWISDFDRHLFSEGKFYQAYEKLGAHLASQNGVKGTHFTVWAPNALKVSVIGDFNHWDPSRHAMQPVGSGLWECFIPDVKQGSLYKFAIKSQFHGYSVDKSDPFSFAAELGNLRASKVWNLDYHWQDSAWMEQRKSWDGIKSPLAIYEVHLGSWQREEGGKWLSYREMATRLAAYVKEMGYTHVEIMPIAEHPFDGSWGYQVLNYYAPTSRFGSPQDFMFLVDTFHQAGIGVILDWVPAHFPKDEAGLSYFDGTHLYEHADVRQGEHKEWGTLVFNYGRPEVCSFLLSNALFWLDKYHIDGLRVDAVASMIYLDYSRQSWVPNKYGGRENLEAIEFLKEFNKQVHAQFPGAITIAEESTSWPLVSKPTYIGGLGFTFKWDMGWMHDTLKYFSIDPLYRKYQHHLLTFRALYAFHENFILPLSHDEVVHEKSSLLGKMPRDPWQKFANLRLLFGYLYASPGKKLTFMGGEMGQWTEWNHDASLDFHLLAYPAHQGVQRWVRDLNTFYRSLPFLSETDCQPEGFLWVDCQDAEQSTISFLRKGKTERDCVLFILNLTPIPRANYKVGVPMAGRWEEVLNSDATLYGGSGQGNLGGVDSSPIAWHIFYDSLNLTLPPLAMVAFKPA